MSDLYSILSGTIPTAQDTIQAELLCTQILQAKYPDMDLRTGTGIRDLVIRPAATLLASLKLATDYLLSQNTLSNATDNTPTELVDTLLSNLFMSRNVGSKAIISARLYFARQKNTVLNSNTYFSTDNILKFFPAQSVSYALASMNFDSFSNEYYIDVELTAETEGSAYNIGSGSLLYFSSFDPYFLRAEINFLIAESIPSETNTQFIARSTGAISTRNLINVPSIDYLLKSQFNYISRLLSTGYGDVEMIRDQFKAVFEDVAPITLTALTSTGTLATATLANHGYSTGQLINLAGGVPTGYNGQYSITVTDTSHFTYVLGSSLGTVTTLPQVNPVNNPVLLHNGGFVDVYCVDSLASAIVQVTTDGFGKAHLTGPIYDFSRSSISGGSSADTLPLNNTANISSVNIVGTVATATTSAPHSFALTDVVTVVGATQNQTISAISCSTLTVTATVANHGFLVGNSVVIAGVTPSSYNGTFTITAAATNTFQYVVPANISGSGSGTMLASVNLVNGTWPLVGASTNTFSYNIAQASTFAVSGTITSQSPVPYTRAIANSQTKTLTSISSVGTVNTVTLPLHGYSLGRYVTIAGTTPTGYIGSWLITGIISPNQFTFSTPTHVSGTTTTGTIINSIPWYDNGFSQKQDMIVGFGSSNANKTASFTINYFQNLDSIQAYLDSSANRVICADYLARGFNFYKLSVTITSYNVSAPSSSLVTNLINSYLNSLDPGSTFVMSDMMTKLRLNGIFNIQNPPLVTYKKYNRDLTPVETGTLEDILDPNDRTNVFLLDSVVTQSLNIATGVITIV